MAASVLHYTPPSFLLDPKLGKSRKALHEKEGPRSRIWEIITDHGDAPNTAVTISTAAIINSSKEAGG